MITTDELIRYARLHQCSDIHLSASSPVIFRRIGRLEKGPYDITDEQCQDLILSMLDDGCRQALKEGKDLDFSFQSADGKHHRVNVYREKGHFAAAIRILNDEIPTIDALQLPPILKQFADEPRGLVLITGPTGSGKSTTLAAMIQYINATRAAHIITIEDPIEYFYSNQRALIHQREVGSDVMSFESALRSAMREDPDVLLVGEMRDLETISAAMTAAETGHLVLSTLHTTGAAQTIDRIIDAFQPHGQNQIRIQLAGVLKGVVTQVLVPRADGSGRVAATEVLVGTDAALSMIRGQKTHQLGSVMQSGRAAGMMTLPASLAKLVQKQVISYATALEYAGDEDELTRYLNVHW
jgi:twitching motility protein PilT